MIGRIAARAALVAALAAVSTAGAQDAWPRRIPASGGEVIIPNAAQQGAYDVVGYAPARRLGDTLYLSGAIIWRGRGEGTDPEAFERQARRTFRSLDATLRAAGASFDDVAMMNSFHVWEGPDFTGTRDQQIAIMTKVRREFTDAPAPAWTAVGTTGLLGEGGIVEVQLIAHAPRAH